MSAAESAVEKLEAFVSQLSPEEQAELTPLIAGGMAKAYEEAQGEVQGLSAMNLSIEPRFLQFVSKAKTPSILNLGGATFFPPMPLPM
jgi:hypothetical protein